MAFQITSVSIIYSTAYSGKDLRKCQSSESLALVRGIHRSPVNSSYKGPVARKMFSFDDVILILIVSNEKTLPKRLTRIGQTYHLQKQNSTVCKIKG